MQHAASVAYAMGKIGYCNVAVMDLLGGVLCDRKERLSARQVLNVLYTCEVRWAGWLLFVLLCARFTISPIVVCSCSNTHSRPCCNRKL